MHQKIFGYRLGKDIADNTRISSTVRTQLWVKMRIRKKPDIKYQIGIVRDTKFETQKTEPESATGSQYPESSTSPG